MKLRFIKNQRGFKIATFKDLYGKNCSIQQSSLATDNAIWFGCEEGTHYLGTTPVDKIEYECVARMHLSRQQIKDLLPVLTKFAETGNLP